METITENYNWTHCREQGIAESPALGAHVQFLHLWLRENLQNGKGNAVPREHWEVVCELVSLRNGHINKMGTMATSVDT